MRIIEIVSVCSYMCMCVCLKEIEKEIQLNQNLLDQQELWRDGFLFTKLKSIGNIKNNHRIE